MKNILLVEKMQLQQWEYVIKWILHNLIKNTFWHVTAWPRFIPLHQRNVWYYTWYRSGIESLGPNTSHHQLILFVCHWRYQNNLKSVDHNTHWKRPNTELLWAWNQLWQTGNFWLWLLNPRYKKLNKLRYTIKWNYKERHTPTTNIITFMNIVTIIN